MTAPVPGVGGCVAKGRAYLVCCRCARLHKLAVVIRQPARVIASARRTWPHGSCATLRGMASTLVCHGV
jgi:hypothetical protein